MADIEKIIDQLIGFYEANCKERTMEYTFGFFDAVGVLWDLQKELCLK